MTGFPGLNSSRSLAATLALYGNAIRMAYMDRFYYPIICTKEHFGSLGGTRQRAGNPSSQSRLECGQFL